MTSSKHDFFVLFSTLALCSEHTAGSFAVATVFVVLLYVEYVDRQTASQSKNCIVAQPLP